MRSTTPDRTFLAMVYDVIIAGAGPVGLFLACELRLARLSVLVLEQLEDPHSPLKRLPFGLRGLWGPSIDAFYRRGLLEQVAAQPDDDKTAGLPRPSSIASASQPHGPGGHFAGIQFDYVNVDPSRWTYRLAGPADVQLAVEMDHLERILSTRALSVGVEIQRGRAVDASSLGQPKRRRMSRRSRAQRRGGSLAARSERPSTARQPNAVQARAPTLHSLGTGSWRIRAIQVLHAAAQRPR